MYVFGEMWQKNIFFFFFLTKQIINRIFCVVIISAHHMEGLLYSVVYDSRKNKKEKRENFHYKQQQCSILLATVVIRKRKGSYSMKRKIHKKMWRTEIIMRRKREMKREWTRERKNVRQFSLISCYYRKSKRKWWKIWEALCCFMIFP